MSDGSTIEWLQRPGTKPATWNPIRAYSRETGKRGWFCVHASDGCRFCYAERINMKAGATGGTGHAYIKPNLSEVRIELHEETLMQPLRWRHPRTIFPCSMTDIFGEWVTDEMLDRMFAVMALTPQHTYLPLTKRAERMRQWFSNPDRADNVGLAMLAIVGRLPHGHRRVPWPLPNAWLGVSAERQQEANERIPLLLQMPAAVRFVSLEPLLGAIDLTTLCNGYYFIDALSGRKYHDAPEGEYSATEACSRLDLVIAGGESGSKARGCPRAHFRSLRNQCARAEVAYFHKQNGEWIDADEWLDAIEAGPSRLLVDGEVWRPTRPLNFDDAELLAIMTGRDGKIEHHSDGTTLIRVGKKAAGRLLDSRAHDEFPRGVA